MKAYMYRADSPKFSITRRDCPADAFPLDFEKRAWIEAEDCKILRVLDEEDKYFEIEFMLAENGVKLLNAYERGESLCYDGDPNAQFPDPDGIGGASPEIFWAIKYRGGLRILEVEA